MSLPGQINPLFETTPGYPIQKSVRLRSSASAYLNRTFTTPTNNKIWTYSFWIKLGTIGTEKVVLGTSVSNTPFTKIYFDTNSNFTWYEYTGSNYVVTTTQVFRDPSSWYHVVLAVDTTQATASNRAKLYINGVQVTSFSSSSYVPQNTNTTVNSAVATYIGQPGNGGSYLDGYLTEINFIDGQALTASSFGAFNATTGVWQPIKYTGTYGTNGFYLNFSNNASTTTLGYDTSGNGNNWTTNNISLTAGSTYDSMTDVPTLTSATAANYAVLNPLWHGANITPTDGNLTNPLSSGSPNAVMSTMPMSTGKWYAEMTNTGSYASVGLCILAANLTAPTFTIGSTVQTGLWEVYDNGTGIYVTSDGGAFSGSLGSSRFLSAGTIQFAYDATNGYFWIGRNNTWYDSSWGTTGNPSTGANPTFTISSSRGPFNIAAGSNSATNPQYWNFGQQPWTYTPPTGFVALNTYNLPTPTIKNGAAYMAATTYTGTGASLTVTNTVNSIGFQPDLLWIKCRSFAFNNNLIDSVRGITKDLLSNTTDAETTIASFTSFNSNGFTFSSDNTQRLNDSGQTYVGWNWKAGGTGSSNTNGSITSTVSVNATAGFSVVTYTGTGSNATVGHGLGVAPSMVIVKSRNTAGTYWCVYHASLGATQYIYLNTAGAAGTYTAFWNNTAPTSSVFTVGTQADTNGSGYTMVTYCFAPIKGYSAFGSYTGNGSTDGPFIFTGFRPRFILIKRTDSTSDWFMYDTSRSPYNVGNQTLTADATTVEGSFASTNYFDFVSNGFKIRQDNSSGYNNASGVTYIYACFAENPFNYSLAR